VLYEQLLSSSRDGRPFGHNRDGPKIGGVPLFLAGAGSQSNTMWPVPRHTSVSSGILINPPISPQQTRAENWGLCPRFWGGAGGAGSLSNTMSPRSTPTFVPSGIWINPAVWPQQTWAANWERVLCPFLGGSLVPI